MKKQQYLTSGMSVKPVIAVTVGGLISVCITVLLSAILASMVTVGKVLPETIVHLIWPIQFISCVIGCSIATVMGRNMPAIISASSAIVYLLMLVAVNILLMDGNLNGVGTGLLAVLCGSSIPILIRIPHKKGRNAALRH